MFLPFQRSASIRSLAHIAKEFKSFTGFAQALERSVGRNVPLHFYTPLPYSSEFDEFSQVYFYLNRHVQLARCAEQPDVGRCEPGYYLMRFPHWQEVKDSAPSPTAS